MAIRTEEARGLIRGELEAPSLAHVLDWWGWAALRRRLLLLVAVSIGVAVMVLAYFLVGDLVAPRYESTASVLIASPRVDLQFDPRVTTPSPSPDLNSPATSLARRVDTLTTLVKSREVAELAAKDLQPTAEWRGITGADLLAMRLIQTRFHGETLDLTARASTPEGAQALAAAWAKALVARGTTLFASDASGLRNLQSSYDEMQSAYEKAVAAVAANEQSSRRNELAGQLAEADQLSKTLRARSAELTAILAEARLLRARADVQGHDSPAVREGVIGLLTRLRSFDAVVGASGLSSSVIVQADPRAQLDANADPVATLDDLVALVAAQLDPNATGNGGAKGLAQQLADAEDRMRALRAEIERQNAEYTKLVSDRDALKTSLQTVSNKRAEAQLATSLGQGELSVSVDASEAIGPSLTSHLSLALAAGAMTFLVLAILVLFTHLFKYSSAARLARARELSLGKPNPSN